MARMSEGRGGYPKNPSEAHAKVPHGGVPREGPAHPKSYVGNETKADMKGAMMGQPEDKNPLKGAVSHLHDEHPIPYHDHGPHHGHDHHIRHEPLHGLHPKAHHGRRRG